MRFSFSDGLRSLVSSLINSKNPLNTNRFEAKPLDYAQMRAIYRTGLGSKIVRIKAGYSLNDTLQFEKKADADKYRDELEKAVKKAARFMIGFGRGIIVINTLDRLDTPLDKNKLTAGRYKLDVFSGDMVTTVGAVRDLMDRRYMKPTAYQVRGYTIHHSRVIDFAYVQPTEEDLPFYQYGGVSEFELIYSQLINDTIIERAVPQIIEKNATVFHKVQGFKESLAAGQEKDLLEYFSQLAQLRGIYGDAVIDKDDDAISVAQALTNLADCDQITLRRLSMVTGIAISALVGENVKGLNSSGDNERQVTWETIEDLQFSYLLEPLVQLCALFGITGVKFKDNQGGTALERVDYETKVIDNAVKLSSIAEDYEAYLVEHDVVKADESNVAKMFGGEDDAGN